jgi:hypothetical protein
MIREREVLAELNDHGLQRFHIIIIVPESDGLHSRIYAFPCDTTLFPLDRIFVSPNIYKYEVSFIHQNHIMKIQLGAYPRVFR